MEGKCCKLEIKTLMFATLSHDIQRAVLCHNLLEMAKAHGSEELVSFVFTAEAKSIWKCNLKGKKGYTWDSIKKGDMSKWVKN